MHSGRVCSIGNSEYLVLRARGRAAKAGKRKLGRRGWMVEARGFRAAGGQKQGRNPVRENKRQLRVKVRRKKPGSTHEELDELEGARPERRSAF
jgi:hypothetical protein